MKLPAWMRSRWFALIMSCVVSLSAGLLYLLDPNRPQPPGATGTGYACLFSCSQYCLDRPEGVDVGCMLKCVIWCFVPKEPEIVADAIHEGTGETAIPSPVANDGTGEGTQ